MAMDMLEFEVFVAGASIASRLSQVLETITEGLELPSSFLVKRMEISFVALPHVAQTDGSTGILYLIFVNKTRAGAVNTIAEMLDARGDDIHGHQGIIWLKMGYVSEDFIDAANGLSTGQHPWVLNTSKSFPKGFRLDKDEEYTWEVFNPSTGALDLVGSYALRTRYWGVNMNG